MKSGAGHDAAQKRRAVLAAHNAATVSADAELHALLSSAHEAAVQYGRRLDNIEHAINDAVSRQSELGIDTPAGAAQFRRFLHGQHRDILAIVEEAHKVSAAFQAQARAILAGYSAA